jgi:NitT/TauT family transport system ATP-binding protein
MRVEKIRKRFGSLEVIAGVTINFPRGRITSIVGENGCGKTTLLNMIVGKEEPDSGKIVFGGGENHNVGYVQQVDTLLPHKTVQGNIAFPLRTKPFLHLRSKEREVTEALIEMMELSEFRDCYPYQLSGGMRQKVLLARALSIRPNLLLLDEPSKSLSERAARQLQNEVREIWNELRPTVIVATHNVEEAVYLSERIVVLSDRPATVKEVVDVRFNSRENLRSSEEFFRKVNKIRRIRDR